LQHIIWPIFFGKDFFTLTELSVKSGAQTMKFHGYLTKRGCPRSRLLPGQPLQFHVVSLKRHEIAAFIPVSEEVLQQTVGLTFRTPRQKIGLFLINVIAPYNHFIL
jgi:hypothetical protein